MTKYLLASFFVFHLWASLFAQKPASPDITAADPQELKNLMGKNTSAGLDPYYGIGCLFHLEIKGLKTQELADKFDMILLRDNPDFILSCRSEKQINSTIVVNKNIDITDLKVFIYAAGKKVIPGSGIEIISYKKEHYIKNK